MKHLFIAGALAFGLFFTACSSGEAGGEAGGEGAKSSAMSTKDIESQHDELEGKEVTVKGISWGNSETMSGEVSMSLADKKLEGMQQAHVVAVFGADKKDAAAAVKEGDEVTIKATVGPTEYGATKLLNPTIVK